MSSGLVAPLADHVADTQHHSRGEQDSSGCGCSDTAIVVPYIINGDTVTPRIINGQTTTAFPSVGLIGDRFGYFCSGTLIDSTHVLTAAHCSDGLGQTSGRFKVNGVVYTTTQITIHPDYNPGQFGTDNANDIAIWTLSKPVTGVTPSPIFTGTPQVGDLLTLVGFGGGGTGDTGSNGDFGIKRVGTTPIDEVSSTLISWNFDNNSESNTAPGDSGGPAFLQVGGVYYVAGITSGGDKADASLGDHSFDTRVDAYADWIDSILNPSPPPGGDDHGNSRSDATAIAVTSLGAGSATGTIGAASDLDYFSFKAPKSGHITINLNTIASDLDPVLKAYSSAGKLLASNDDYGSGNNSRVRFRVTSGQTYYIEASSWGGTTGNYQVVLNNIGR